MGLIFVTAKLSNPAKPEKISEVEFLVDSGAIYSVVDGEMLKSLELKPHSTKTFTFANGERVEREIGDAIFEYGGERGASPVIFGQKDDSALLGAVSLEALGMMLDTLRRIIKPLPMVLGGMPKE